MLYNLSNFHTYKGLFLILYVFRWSIPYNDRWVMFTSLNPFSTLFHPANCPASQVVLVVENLSASAADVRDAGSIPGSGKSSGEGNGNPLQYSFLENPTDRGALRAAVPRGCRVRHDWSDLACTCITALGSCMEYMDYIKRYYYTWTSRWVWPIKGLQ